MRGLRWLALWSVQSWTFDCSCAKGKVPSVQPHARHSLSARLPRLHAHFIASPSDESPCTHVAAIRRLNPTNHVMTAPSRQTTPRHRTCLRDVHPDMTRHEHKPIPPSSATRSKHRSRLRRPSPKATFLGDALGEFLSEPTANILPTDFTWQFCTRPP